MARPAGLLKGCIMKRMVFIVTLALMPVGTFGQDLDAGLEAKEQGDYARALQELRLLADEGHAAGQYYLGEMYTSAKGVRWNPAEGLRWTMLAAENGYVRAQTVLGSLYLSSSFENHAEAVRWYSLAAKQGDADAQFNLANLYYEGYGVAQDYVQAHMWFNIAATSGYAAARENRGILASIMTTSDISESQRRARVCVASDFQECD